DIARASGHAVFDDNAGHSYRIQPGCHFLAFELPIQVPIATYRTDQHRCSRVLVFGRLVDRERRLGNVGNQFGRSDEWRGMNAAVFLAVDADVSWCFPGPEIDHTRFGRESCANHEDSQEYADAESKSCHR